MNEQQKKLELLQKRIASLSPEKRAIFEHKLKEKTTKNIQYTILPRQDLYQRSLDRYAPSKSEKTYGTSCC